MHAKRPGAEWKRCVAVNGRTGGGEWKHCGVGERKCYEENRSAGKNRIRNLKESDSRRP